MQQTGAPCPICATEAQVAHASSVRVVCPRCGVFLVTEEVIVELRMNPLNPHQMANASGWIAESRPPLIKTYHLPHLRTLATPSVRSRLDRLLLRLQKETTALGTHVPLDDQRRPAYVAATYSMSEGELRYLVESLVSRGLVTVTNYNWVFPTLTHEAYAYVDEHLVKNAESPVGFCAMWFADDVLPLWERTIQLAIDAAGYVPLRLDKHEHNNRIDDEIIASIRRARFLVADLTAHRQGVYFEAGFAMGLGIPVVWMVREDELSATHFDNRQFNFIVWTADSLDEAMVRLQHRIEATVGRGPQAVS